MKEFTQYNNFLANKYYIYYINLIKKSRDSNRIYDNNVHENHHILPKSIGGSDGINNMVILTFKEHYIAHRLLPKFTEPYDKMKMCWSLHCFFNLLKAKKYRKANHIINTNSRVYENFKKELSYYTKKYRIPHTKQEKFLFRHMDTLEEFYGTRDEFHKTHKLSQQEIYNLIQPNNRLRHSKRWGIWINEENIFSTDKRIAKSPPTKKIECPYCNKSIDYRNYGRWHGDKCKINISTTSI